MRNVLYGRQRLTMSTAMGRLFTKQASNRPLMPPCLGHHANMPLELMPLIPRLAGPMCPQLHLAFTYRKNL